MVTLLENVYQVSKGLQNFMVSKVTEKIREAFSELNAKVRSRNRLQLNKQMGYQLKQRLAA